MIGICAYYQYRVSNLLGSPASGGSGHDTIGGDALKFPIYWVPQRVGGLLSLAHNDPKSSVSNLLGSPASGGSIIPTVMPVFRRGFQFIGFPSEWGVSKFPKVANCLTV